jgi:chromosome segregation ATPase
MILNREPSLAVSTALVLCLSVLSIHVSAFSTRATPACMVSSPRSVAYPSYQVLYMSGGDDKFSPRPPNAPPNIPADLERELYEKERRIMLYEKEIEMVREQLDLKVDELMDDKNNFRVEKLSLMSKLGEFTNMLAARDEEFEGRIASEKEAKAKAADLENEIESLTKELEQKQKDLDVEADTVKALRKRLGETQDTLEYEQMEFDKEKAALQNIIVDEKKNLKQLISQLQQNESAFETTQKELIARVSKEEEKMTKAKQEFQQTQETLAAQEQNLRDQIKEQQGNLEKAQKDIEAQQGDFGSERSALKKIIMEEQGKIKETQELLQREETRFATAEQELQKLIKEEQAGALRLQNQSTQELQKFESEKVNLELRIKKEHQMLADLQSQLEDERAEFSTTKKRLESQLEEEIRVGKFKKRQMNDRFQEIRKEMTALWEGAKRENRENEHRLTTKYKKRIDEIQGRVNTLQNEVEVTSNSNAELTALLNEVKRQKEQVELEQKATVSRYEDMLSQRGKEIADLTGNVERQERELNRCFAEVRGLKAEISEKDEKITKYETSVRASAALAIKVTAKKLTRPFAGLKRMIQNEQPNELD